MLHNYIEGKEFAYSEGEYMKKIILKIVFCLLFTALIALGAVLKIDIPMSRYTMHFTLQWLFVLGAAFLLGSKWGSLSVLIYILSGLAGLPIFASGGGWDYVLRPSFGFLLGFLVAVFVCGFVVEKAHFEQGYELFLVALIGMVFYYVIGALYFYFMKNAYYEEAISMKTVWLEYCLVTITPDLVLCAVASALSYQFKPQFDKLFERE